MKETLSNQDAGRAGQRASQLTQEENISWR